MFSVIFEVRPGEGRREAYLGHARMLKPFDEHALGNPCDLGRDRRHNGMDEGPRKGRVRVFDHQRELDCVLRDVSP